MKWTQRPARSGGDRVKAAGLTNAVERLAILADTCVTYADLGPSKMRTLMPEYDDESGEPLPHNSRTVAKDIAEAQGFLHMWESYHPVVKLTLEWLDEHGYLMIEPASHVIRGND